MAESLSDQSLTGEFQLLPSEALLHQICLPSPSSSVCSVVLSVQVITFEYQCSQQDRGTLGAGYQDFGFVK